VAGLPEQKENIARTFELNQLNPQKKVAEDCHSERAQMPPRKAKEVAARAGSK